MGWGWASEVQFGGWGVIGEARPDEWPGGSKGGGGGEPGMKQSSVRGTVTEFKLEAGCEKGRPREGFTEEAGLELGSGIRPGPCRQHQGGQTGRAAFDRQRYRGGNGISLGLQSLPSVGPDGQTQKHGTEGLSWPRDFAQEASVTWEVGLDREQPPSDPE